MCTRHLPVRPADARTQAGISYLELIVFIIVVGIAVAGVLRVFNQSARSSADPQVRKQMLAAAEALLDEIELKPFTYCDPDDTRAATADSDTVGPAANQCEIRAEAMNPEAAFGSQPGPGPETRNSTSAPFDNVNDYNGYTQTPVTDVNGSFQLTGYTAAVAVASEALEGSVPAAETLRITVTITRSSGETLSLTGYRLRYAPRTVP